MLANQFDLFGSVDCECIGFFSYVMIHECCKKVHCLYFCRTRTHIDTLEVMRDCANDKNFDFFWIFFLFLFKMNSQYWMKTIAFIEYSNHLLAIWMIYYRSINSKFDIWSIEISFLFKIYFRYDFELVLNKEKTNNFQWSSREKSSEF